jgi:deferrochelatase/peroxidase EfeB
MTDQRSSQIQGSPVSRRRFLGAAGAAGAIGAAATLGTEALAAPTRAFGALAGEPQIVPFHGRHQAGISTVVQDRLMFASFDVRTEDRAELVDLMREWTRASERMSVGRPVGSDNEDLVAPPDDTGEAVGLTPANLTVTFGFGSSLFAREGQARFGLDGQRPEALVDLPLFNSDVLDPARSDGDLAVQACADDPQVAFHAIRNLTRIGRGAVTLRWSQLGFGRTSTTSPVGQTPRNLMGFKDGTNNVKSDERAELDRHVWVGAADRPAWMRDGSYLVVRRIRMLLEVWDRSTLGDQELTIGRVKDSGAPLGETREHQPLDLAARQDGEPVIPADAHVRLAAPETNDGAAMLRRGYSFTDGIDPVRNQRDAGLFFIAYQRDPRTGFIPVQERLARNDALNEYIRHETSGIFAVPPGVRPGGYVGETLLG